MGFLKSVCDSHAPAAEGNVVKRLSLGRLVIILLGFLTTAHHSTPNVFQPVNINKHYQENVGVFTETATVFSGSVFHWFLLRLYLLNLSRVALCTQLPLRIKMPPKAEVVSVRHLYFGWLDFLFCLTFSLKLKKTLTLSHTFTYAENIITNALQHELMKCYCI